MTGNLPRGFGSEQGARQSGQPRSPEDFGRPAPRSRPWLTVTAAGATAALVAALTRTIATRTPAISTSPSFSAAGAVALGGVNQAQIDVRSVW